MAIRPNFPLPKGYFGPLSLSKEQEERYREVVRRRLETALAEENEFTVARKRQVDTSKWKLVKSKRQLHIYRQRAVATVLADAKRPSMLGVGRIEGTLEDVVYGMYSKSHEEMNITMKYIDTSCKDCTVLHAIDLETPSDPFHYLGFKYLVTGFPGGFMMKPRDWVYLEAAGIERDRMGRRYGYTIMQSVNLPNVAPFDRGDCVRSQLFSSFLFREQDGGFVDVFSQGLFDPAGDMIQRVSSIMTAEALLGIRRSVRCAEAKKLTILALADSTERSHFSKHRCSVCTSSGGKLLSSLRECRVCGAPVCSKCRVKKFIFAGSDHAIVNISCCPPCVLRAKVMDIRPADEAFSILGEKHLPQDLFRAESAQYSNVSDVPTPRDFLEDKPSVCVSESDDEGYSLSVCSGMSEDDVEGMIEAMMKKKLANSRRGETDRTVLLEGVEHRSAGVPLYTSERTPRSPHVPIYDGVHYAQQSSGSSSEAVSIGGPHPHQMRATPSHHRNVGSPVYESRFHGAGGADIPHQHPPMNPHQAPAMASHQAELFHKMLALQNSAQQVYAMTKANEAYMRNMH